MQVVLASQSPRRQKILARIIPSFLVCPSTIDEAAIKHIKPKDFVLAVSMAKAKNVASKFSQGLIIAADTVVVLNDRIIGKPKDFKQARETLELLSAGCHSVITGVCLFDAKTNRFLVDSRETFVIFKKLKCRQIDNYLKNNNVFDKAGSYAIQVVGKDFVENIEGDYDNVVGLPLNLLQRMLEQFFAPLEYLTVHDLALPLADGVAKNGKKVYFLKHSLPGETWAAKIVREKKHIFYAEPIYLCQASGFRVKPKCHHFGVCGGCVLQHISYPSQISFKKKHFLENLKRIAGIDFSCSKLTIVKSPRQYNYRNKMQYFAAYSASQIKLGIGGQSLVDLDVCPVFSRNFAKLKRGFKTILEKYSVNSLPQQLPQRLVVKEAKFNNQVMLIIEVNAINPTIKAIAQELSKKLSFIKSIYLKTIGKVGQVKYELVFGKECLLEQIGKYKFNIYPDTFFQTNTHACGLLYDQVKKFLPKGKLNKILGLYSGSGALEICLADCAELVVGLDDNSSNVKAALANCQLNKISNCRFYHNRAETFLMHHVLNEYDLVFVDPPRQGLSQLVLEKIGRSDIRQLIYISCEPATFARDVKVFMNYKFELKRVTLVDMFPQTGHVEVIGLLSREKNG